MPHVSKKYTHTSVTDLNTKVTFVLKNFSTDASITYATNNISPSKGGSPELYKDIRDLITSVNDFPFEYSFIQDDSEIVYTNSNPAPIFTIGGVEYNAYLSMGLASNPVEAPYAVCAKQDALSGNFLHYPLRDDYQNVSSSPVNGYYKTTCNVLNSEKTGISYTLHLYYNTDYFMLGFTTDTCDVVSGIITQVKLKDRTLKDWYLITSTLGSDVYPLANYANLPTYRIRYAGNPNGALPGDSDRCQIVEAYVKRSDESVASTISAVPYSPSPRNGGSHVVAMLINPCDMIDGTSFTGTKINYLKCFSADLSDTTKIAIASPIILNGMVAASSQILVTSTGIIPNQEYTINNKTYFCPGDVHYTNMPMPFLLEI